MYAVDETELVLFNSADYFHVSQGKHGCHISQMYGSQGNNRFLQQAHEIF